MRPRTKIQEPPESGLKLYDCFVCGKKSPEKGISLLLAQTAFSRIPLGEKLQEILGSKYLVLVSPKDKICWDCGCYVNWVDKLEHKIDLLKEFLLNHISAKYKKIEVRLNNGSEVPEPEPVVAEKVTHSVPSTKHKYSAELKELRDDPPYKGRRRKEYRCKYCTKEYVSLVSLTMHIQKLHGGKEVCDDCGLRFDSYGKLKRHVKLCHSYPEKELTCVSCGFHTTNTEVYCRHFCNSRIVSLTCITCNKRYVDSNFSEDAGSYQCQTCQLTESAARLIVNESQDGEPSETVEEPETTPQPQQEANEGSKSHLSESEEIGGSELASEMPEFFKEPYPKESERSKKENVDYNPYLRCEGCGEQFKYQQLTRHPCFIRGDEVEFVDVEFPLPKKLSKQDQNLLRCKTCNFSFTSIEALRSHWDHTGHLREVNTQTVEVNKIRDKLRKTEATFKVVKQNFNIRGSIRGQLDEMLQSTTDYKDIFIKVSDNKADAIEEFITRDGNRCGTCGLSFPTPELLSLHQMNDCLTCVTCGVSFFDNKLLKKHYMYTGHANKIIRSSTSQATTEIRTPFGFKCHKCEKSFQTRFLLQKHFAVHYKGTDKGACQFCLTEFENKSDIQQHVLEVHGAHLYKCSICERTFMSEMSKNKHELKHKAPLECNICKDRFTNKKSLLLHNETFHHGCACRLCGKVVQDPISLKRHERRHYFDKELECDICKKRFRSKVQLLSHSKYHLAEDVKFRCDVCQLGFASESSLTEHKLSHITPGKYKCTRCSKTFASKAHFWMHSKTHDASYICSVCNRSFRDTSLLAIHRRKHWRARPYQCPQCHRTFSVPGTLQRHLHSHTRMFPHRCGICKKGFLTRHAYHRHTETVHAVSNSFPQRRPNIPSLPLNATDEDLFQAADTLIADDSIMFNEYQANKELEQPASTDLITNEVVVETTELFDEILH